MTPTPSESGSASSGMPLRPAMKGVGFGEGALDGVEPMSPKSGPKVVSIAEPEHLEPLEDQPSPRMRQYSASVSSRRLSGRPGMPSNSSSRLSMLSQSSMEDTATDTSHTSSSKHPEHSHGHGHRHGKHHHHEKLLSQVAEWLQAEKAKRATKKANKKSGKNKENESMGESPSFRPRTESQSSDSSSISLEKLQRILEDNMSNFSLDSLPLGSPVLAPRKHMTRRRSSARKLGGGGWASSDTEYQDGDIVVPSCDVVLDNSKAMSYCGGAPVLESSDQTVTMSTSRRAEKEKKAWMQFKGEIVRLAHTLRLKGWRRVPLERGGEIEVERLSGALTNAVYVVSPPKELPVANTHPKPHSPKPSPKLLLRIYGPQVEHLIDRENELSILRRLSRKKIGPRLLGTFRNGRFEEFFEAQTLRAEDLRVEDTMKQIAKRMRELHEGVDLLDREREEGPFVWRNWDKWVARCEEVITYLDSEILSKRKGKGESWRERGLVCGVEWKMFKEAVDKYRKWLNDYYKKRGGVESRLVFAHNDTQYGNILRLIPPTASAPCSDGTLPPPSPLLLPQNHHKQLIVIDFEYASANTPGLEFANHFTEWCYNYHDPSAPEACHTSRYPSLDQQKRFIRSYVNHRPQFNPRASATPKLAPIDGNTTSGMRGGVSEFLLDSRAPGGGSTSTLNLNDGYQSQRSPSLQSQGSFNLTTRMDDNIHNNYAEEERRREADAERQVQFLLEETHIWRVANSAQWVAWGIVQAKLPEDCPSAAADDTPEIITEEPEQIVNGERKDKRPEGLVAEALLNGESIKEAEAEGEGEEDAFDYLAYAKERAMFFWGDVVTLGIVKKEELPEDLVKGLKIVEY